jgi:ribosomal protein L29
MSKKQITKVESVDMKGQVTKAREELFQLKLEHSMRKLKNTRSIFLKRKEIANLLTNMHMKEVTNG